MDILPRRLSDPNQEEINKKAVVAEAASNKEKAKAKEMKKAIFPQNALSCMQTPLQFPKDRTFKDIPEYNSNEIRIYGTSAGPGRLLSRTGRDGQLIEESPQTTLLYERNVYNISDTILHFPGMHKGPNQEKPYEGEMHIYFRSQKPNKDRTVVRDDLCLIIPIRQGTGKGVTYFEFLNRDASVRSEFLPALTSVLTDKTPAILYKGKDLKNRGCGLPNPDSQCLPDSYTIQYIFLQQPIQCRAKDMERLKSANSIVELESPSEPVSVVDLRRFCAYYRFPGLRVGTNTGAQDDLPAGVRRMDSLKCRPIDPKKDIRGDKIIIDPAARNVRLLDELNAPATLSDGSTASTPGAPGTDPYMQPGDFEDLLALPIGVAAGIFVAGWLTTILDAQLFLPAQI